MIRLLTSVRAYLITGIWISQLFIPSFSSAAPTPTPAPNLNFTAACPAEPKASGVTCDGYPAFVENKCGNEDVYGSGGANYIVFTKDGKNTLGAPGGSDPSTIVGYLNGAATVTINNPTIEVSANTPGDYFISSQVVGAGDGYECWELAARYFKFRWQIDLNSLPDRRAQSLCTEDLSSLKVTRHPADGSYIPVPGDLVAYNSSIQHVAVVTAVDSKTRLVTTLNQNGPTALAPPGPITGPVAPACGYIHANNNPNTSSTCEAGTAAGDLAVDMEPYALSVFNTGVGVGVDTKGFLEVFTRDELLSQTSQALGDNTQSKGYFTAHKFAYLTTDTFMTSDPVVVANANGMLDVFFINQDGNIWHSYQTGYNNTERKGFSVNSGQNGASNQSDSVWSETAQVTDINNALGTDGGDLPAPSPTPTPGPSAAPTPTPIPTPTTAPTSSNSSPCVITDGGINPTTGAPSAPASNVAAGLAQGLIHLYYIGHDGAIWGVTQTAANAEDGWSKPVSYGKVGIPSGHPTLIVNKGIITVYYRSDEVDTVSGNRGFIYSMTQSGTGMSKPVKIVTSPEAVISSNVTPIVNPDGRIELFYRGSEEGLWHIWQTGTDANAAWSTPKQLSETGGTLTSDPVAILNSNKQMQVFYRGTEGDIWTVVRNKDNAGAGEWDCRDDLVNSIANKVDISSSPITVAANSVFNNGALQLFYVGETNTNNGGKVNNADVDSGVEPHDTPNATTAASSNDVWTLVQTAAGSNPNCPTNDKTGWTTPVTIGGQMVEVIPTATDDCSPPPPETAAAPTPTPAPGGKT